MDEWSTVKTVDERKSKSPGSCTRRTNPEARIRFCVEYGTRLGQFIRVVGSDSKLGSWKADDGLKMEWKAGFWTAEASLAPGEYEFKYVVVEMNGGRVTRQEWEDGENRRLVVDETCLDQDDDTPSSLTSTPATPRSPPAAAGSQPDVPFVMELHDLWQSPHGQSAVQVESTTSDVLVGWKAPVVRALFAQSEGGGPSDQRRHAVVLFRVNAWLKKSHCLAVIGNIPALGNWSSERAVRLDDADYPTWSLNIVSHDLKFEYKYIVLSAEDKDFVMWEDGPNRSVTVSPGKEMLAVVCNDGPFRRHGWGLDACTAQIDPRAFKELGLRERLMGVAAAAAPSALSAAFAPASDQVVAPRANSRAAVLRTLQMNIFENGELRRRLRIVEEQNRRLVELMERRSQQTLDAYLAKGDGLPAPPARPAIAGPPAAGGVPATPRGSQGPPPGSPETPSSPNLTTREAAGLVEQGHVKQAVATLTARAPLQPLWPRTSAGPGPLPGACAPASHHRPTSPVNVVSTPPADPKQCTAENTRFGLAQARRVLDEACAAIRKATDGPTLDIPSAAAGLRAAEVEVRALATRLEKQRTSGVRFLRDGFSDDVGSVPDLQHAVSDLLREAARAQAELAARAQALPLLDDAGSPMSLRFAIAGN